MDNTGRKLLKRVDCLGSVLPTEPKLKRSRLWGTVSTPREPGKRPSGWRGQACGMGQFSNGLLHPGDFPLLQSIYGELGLSASRPEPGLPLPASEPPPLAGPFCCVSSSPGDPVYPWLPLPHRSSIPAVVHGPGRAWREALPSVPPSPFLRAASPGGEELRLQGLNRALYSQAPTGMGLSHCSPRPPHPTRSGDSLALTLDSE